MYLEVKDLKKSYGEGGGYVQVLKGITAGVEQGEMCVIQGTSGSGKSTLLNCIGGLDTVDSGSIVVDGQEVAGLNSKALSNYRREKLGFIFQFYNLVPNLTVKENIQVCQYLTKNPLNNSIKNMVHQVIMIKDGQISKNYRNEKRVPAAELEDL